MKRNDTPSAKGAGRGSGYQEDRDRRQVVERQIPLEWNRVGHPNKDILRNSCRITTNEEPRPRQLDGMSVFPSMAIPLAPSRLEYSDVKFSTQFNRTLMIGRDELEPVDIFGIDACRRLREILYNNQIEQFNSLQRSTWPHILRGRDCTIIGGSHPKKGKSLAYLAPLVHMSTKMIKTFQKEEEDGVIGPVGLILCGSSKSCQKVNEMLTKLLQGTRMSTHTVAGDYDKDSKRRLKETTDFVVTTPPGALSLFEEFFDRFKFERLRYFVLDDTQHTFRHYMPEVKDLIKKIQNFRVKMGKTRPLQTILCGTEWNQVMASATLKVCSDAVLLLESSMGALQYGAIDFRLHYFAEPSEKFEAISKICEELGPLSRSIIICKDSDTMLNVRDKLLKDSKVDIRYLSDEDENVVEKKRQLKCIWKTSTAKQFAIIVTDAILKDLGITDAHTIIHYDLPVGKKEAFADRHMCMWQHFPAISDFNTAGDDALKSKMPLKAYVFLSSADEDRHKLVLKLHAIEIPIPKELLDHAQKESDNLVLKHGICPAFKGFGKCISSDICDFRHYFTKDEVTQESTLPKHGRIQVELLESKDVNHYTAKLLIYYDVVQEKKVDVIRFANLDRDIKKAMRLYYSCSEHLVACGPLRVGSYCATPDGESESLYRRCKIIRQVDTYPGKEDPMYRVFFIDEGGYALKNQSHLFVLPNELSVESRKQITVDLYLAGIQPLGKEPAFSAEAKREAIKITANSIFTGKIALSQGNDVWVTSLIEHKRGLYDEWIQVRSMRLEYTKKYNFAEDNPEHMELLYQSCETASGLNYDRYRALQIIGRDLADLFFQKGEQIEWAFLPNNSQTANGCPSISVWCTYFTSLGRIYVQRDDRTGSLDQLVHEMQDDISSMICDKYTMYATIFQEYYEVGLPVAVLGVDKRWYRGIIVDKLDTGDEVLFDIFYVDDGDIVKGISTRDMFPLRSEYVSKLPFQAIQIRCAHIAPLDTDFDAVKTWPLVFDSAVNNLVEPYFISDGASKSLEIAVTQKLGFAKDFGTLTCRVYDASIFKAGEVIAEIVVENQMAKYTPGGEEEIQSWKSSILDYWNKGVDEATKLDGGTDDDDDDDEDLFLPDEDDFDVFLGFDPADNDKEMHEKAKEVLSNFGVGDVVELPPLPPPTQTAIGETPTGASIDVSGLNTEKISQAQEATEKKVPAGPLLKKPTVEWRQTPQQIVIWIHIPDLTEYSLKLDENLPNVVHRLSFRSQAPDGYGFDLDFLAKLISPIEEKPTGQYLTLKLTKLSALYRWPYLLVGNPKLRWLKQKFDERSLAELKNEGYISDEERPKNPERVNVGLGPGTVDMDDGHDVEDNSDSDGEEMEFSDDFLSDGDE